MKSPKVMAIGSLLVIALCMAGTAYAHHSAAGVDTTKSVTVEGTVKQFKWANPHAWLEIEVINTKGVSELWNFEMTSPALLVPNGWRATSVKAGDKVKVVGRPFKNGDPGGLFVSVTLPTGQVLAQGGAGAGTPYATTPTTAPAKP